MLKADLSVEQVPAPSSRWCSSGHVAVESWSKEGPGTQLEPTLFYRVVSINDAKVNGTYCEPCLVVAQAMARKSKKR